MAHGSGFGGLHAGLAGAEADNSHGYAAVATAGSPGRAGPASPTRAPSAGRTASPGRARRATSGTPSRSPLDESASGTQSSDAPRGAGDAAASGPSSAAATAMTALSMPAGVVGAPQFVFLNGHTAAMALPGAAERDAAAPGLTAAQAMALAHPYANFWEQQVQSVRCCRWGSARGACGGSPATGDGGLGVRRQIEQETNFRCRELPIARIKRVIKGDPDLKETVRAPLALETSGSQLLSLPRQHGWRRLGRRGCPDDQRRGAAQLVRLVSHARMNPVADCTDQGPHARVRSGRCP